MDEMQQITLDQWLSWKEDIREKLRETAGNFVYIGFRLKQIRDSGMFDGAADIFEFAQKEYGLGKSTTSRFIAINEKFSEGGNSLELRQEFKTIGSSKLAEMLTLTDAECQLITEKTTVKEIRELKSFSRQQAPESGRGGEQLTPLQKCLTDFFRGRKELLNAVIAAVSEGRFKDAAEWMNPSGHCTHKKGLCFLFLEDYNTGVRVKLLTEPIPQVMTWPELFEKLYPVFADIFQSGERDVYSAYYENERTVESVETESGTSVPKAGEMQKKQGIEEFAAAPRQEKETEEKEAAGGIEKEEISHESPADTDEESPMEERRAEPGRPELSDVSGIMIQKKASPAAVSAQEPQEEPLPGQLQLNDYPDVVPAVQYQEITEAETSEPDAAAGMYESVEEKDEVKPEEILETRETPESVSKESPESGLEEGELIWMDAEKHLNYLRQQIAIWNCENIPGDILLHAYREAVGLAAALEKLMELRGVRNV